MKQTVCVITSVHSPFDTRIFHKEITSLLRAGYRVVLLANHDACERRGDFTLIGLGRVKNRLARFLRDYTVIPWKALATGAGLYHFHDPELIPVGIFLKACGKKVVYDMHELVYYQIGGLYWLNNRLVNRLFREAYLVFEKLAVRLFDALVLAEDGYREYFAERYPRYRNYRVVRNFPLLSLIDRAAPSGAVKPAGRAVVLYAGTIAEERGIKEMIGAMALLGGKAELWLVGEWDSEELKASCMKLDGGRYARVFGRVPVEAVYAFMKAADIGLSLLHPVKNFVVSLPVKTFEYMACGLPVVMSDFPYWRKTFSSCAVFTDPRDPAGIAACITNLIVSRDERERLKSRAARMVGNSYSWDSEEKKLKELYEFLLSGERESHDTGKYYHPVPE